MPIGTGSWAAVPAISAVGSRGAVVCLVACTIIAERARIVWWLRKMIIYATGGGGGGAAAATTCIFAPVLSRAAAFSVAVGSHCRRRALGWFPHGAAAGWALEDPKNIIEINSGAKRMILKC